VCETAGNVSYFVIVNLAFLKGLDKAPGEINLFPPWLTCNSNKSQWNIGQNVWLPAKIHIATKFRSVADTTMNYILEDETFSLVRHW